MIFRNKAMLFRCKTMLFRNKTMLFRNKTMFFRNWTFASILWTSISSKRRQRRRISITAGWATEGGEACGLVDEAISSSKRANIWGLFRACLCSPSLRTFCFLMSCRRFRSLRSLHPRLWIFAAVGDALASDKVWRGNAFLSLMSITYMRKFNY